MYVGGQLVMLPSQRDDKTAHYYYYNQPDWPNPIKPAYDLKRELVYLDVSEQEVSAVEDPDLLEVALGGPDTTQRLKLLRRIQRLSANAADCANTWDEAVAQWKTKGLRLDPATMQLLPQVRLKVGFTSDASSGDPCDPVATGGYLGADNVLLRVRIDTSTSKPQLIWGYDNASFLYRVASVSADRTMLRLAADPPDAFHVPQTGQWVEVLRTAAFFASEPDETDASGKAQIQRVAAESEGVLYQLAQPYGPAVAGDSTNYMVFTTSLSQDLADEQLPLFVRIWQTALPLQPTGGTVTLADPTTGISTGVTVTISLLDGSPLPDGMFWQIAVRPGTPQGVYPEDLLTAPRAPDGPRRWACPLAVIDWTANGGATVTDCRNSFDNLVELTRRKPGCCTVAVSPGDLKTRSLQSVIDRAVSQAQAVTVCLTAGKYPLQVPLHLDQRHNNLTLECCGGMATLQPHPTSKPTAFADGLIVLTEAKDVTLRNLEIEAPKAPLPEKSIQMQTNILARANLAAQAAFGRAIASFGIRALNSPRLTISGCKVTLEKPANSTVDLFGAAVFLQGDCTGLTVQDCKFTSNTAPTYHPLRFRTEAVAADSAQVFGRFLEQLNRAMTFAEVAPTGVSAPVAVSSPPVAGPGAAAVAPVIAAPAPAAIAPGVAAHAPVVMAPGIAAPAPAAIAPVIAAHGPVVMAPVIAAPVPAAVAPVIAAPAPERAPPSLSLADMRDQRTIAAFQAVAAKRLAVGIVADAAIVATVGILATDWGLQSAAQIDVPCLLTDATIENTDFINLTFATWISAALLSLRLQNNRVTNGVAGLWLEVPGAVAPPASARGSEIYYPQVTYFEEFQLLHLHASSIPLPAQASDPVVPKVDPVREMDLIVRGNQVGLQTAAQKTSAALLLALYGAPARDRPLVQTLSLSGNHLRCAAYAEPKEPAALITLSYSQPCAISGNVILNFGRGNADFIGPSLWLMVENSTTYVTQLAVVGNVFKGNSNLELFKRPYDPPWDHWTKLNADPS
jgi:hypothetical protein